ncbi:Protein ccc1 [Brettanomyces nanus]|uniref:Protein ccc1 n=1 Tax=Eeniella nana TaxID=13502 RepID=A0A875S375_EENNA|nr:Protein ccc1 [Brettanomyces nanus]QPG74815.1 Protein ccc1 [Brettanomyces nanus]
MSDLIIGLSDGLTVPFALTAGLSSLGDSKLVITGGMAELVSGAISMGLGGYLAARSESQYYKAQVHRERQLFFENLDLIDQELEEIILDMGGSVDTAAMFIKDLSKDPKNMIEFIIRYGRGLDEPAENRQLTSALTIGSGYFFGGFIPLVPYFFTTTVRTGLLISVLVMLFTLFWFGYFKSRISMGSECGKWECITEGFQMIMIGSLAAGSAWMLVYLIE